MTTQRQEGGIFETFNGYKNNTIAVVPNSTETLVHVAVIIITILSVFSMLNFYNISILGLFKFNECSMVINVGLSWQASFKFHGI